MEKKKAKKDICIPAYSILIDKWVYLKNVYSLGHGQLNFFKNLLHIETVGIVMLWLVQFFPELLNHAWIIPVILIVYALVMFLVGYILDKRFKLLHSEHRFSNRRDPAIQEILERLRRIEAKGK